MRLALEPHPATSTDAVTGIIAELSWLAPQRLAVTFATTANFRVVRWPLEGTARRVEGLWRHTCFEAFVRRAGDEDYVEFNLSPSGKWAAWKFSGYRSDMKEARAVAPPRIRTLQPAVDRRSVGATLELHKLPQFHGASGLEIGLSAVIEERNGRLSYWALAHPSGDKPDFHHPDCFVARLP